MRQPRFRLQTLIIGIAFLALILMVIIQTVALQRAASREQQLRAALARAEAQKEWAAALNEFPHR
jgi:hypothetical protein